MDYYLIDLGVLKNVFVVRVLGGTSARNSDYLQLYRIHMVKSSPV
jgi:hypothetical protein